MTRKQEALRTCLGMYRFAYQMERTKSEGMRIYTFYSPSKVYYFNTTKEIFNKANQIAKQLKVNK